MTKRKRKAAREEGWHHWLQQEGPHLFWHILDDTLWYADGSPAFDPQDDEFFEKPHYCDLPALMEAADLLPDQDRAITFPEYRDPKTGQYWARYIENNEWVTKAVPPPPEDEFERLEGDDERSVVERWAAGRKHDPHAPRTFAAAYRHRPTGREFAVYEISNNRRWVDPA